MQEQAQGVVNQILPPGIGGPAAALVAIDNTTGEVRAMVGGYNYYKNPYNLAVQGERQPGSSFKVFDLAVALEDGYGPNSRIYSAPFDYPDPPFGTFVVRNDEGGYYNSKIPLWLALAVSDNSVFSRVGLAVGPRNIAALANQFGITTTISLNPSMVIGGLHIGVTPLDMAHAYETIAQNGVLTSGTLASRRCAGGGTAAFKWEETPPAGPCAGPVGIDLIYQPGRGGVNVSNEATTTAVYPADLAQKEKSMMRGVLAYPGTAAAAAIPGVAAWGKTGTTNNYADAWFVGSTPRVGRVPSMTVAVWVGYPDGARSMLHSFGGHPVYGGTFPAEIWRAYVEKAISYYQHPARSSHHSRSSSSGAAGGTAATTPASTTTTSASSSSTNPAGSPSNASTTPTGGTATPPAGADNPGAGSSSGAAQTGTGATSGGTDTTTPPPASDTPPAATPPAGTPAVTTPATTTPATTAPASSTPPNTGTGGGVTAHRRRLRTARLSVIAGPRPGARSAPGRPRYARRRTGARAAADDATAAPALGARLSATLRPGAAPYAPREDPHRPADTPAPRGAADRPPTVEPPAGRPGSTGEPSGDPLRDLRRPDPVGVRARRAAPRHEGAPRDREPPLELHGAGDPDPAGRLDRQLAAAAFADRHRPAAQVAAVVGQPHSERLGELAGTGAEVLEPFAPAPRAHQLDPLERLERANQHGRSDTLRLADGVQEGVKAVGEVDVRASGWAEQRARARGQSDVGVARRLDLVVGLGLDDHASGLAVADDAADQRARDRADVAPVERAHASATAARASSSCSRTLACAVPPEEIFDSSHDRPASSSRNAAGSSPGTSVASSASEKPDSGRSASTAARTSPATAPWASRNGTPAPTRRSATSTAAISSSAAAAASRSRRNATVSSIPRAAANDSASVSTVSKRCSLSSCMSLL